MSKLFSCFWQSKNKRDVSSQENGKRRRRSKENNELFYIDTGANTEKQAGNLHRSNGNVTRIYIAEINSQNPQHVKCFNPDANRQSRSYPVSPERRSICKVYSLDQTPSLEIQRLSKAANRKNSTEPRNLTAYAANVACVSKTSDDSLPYGIPMENIPRRSTARQVDYGEELLIANGSARYTAEKPAEEIYEPGTSEDKPDLPSFGINNYKNIQGSERQSHLRISKMGNDNFYPRISGIGNKNVTYLASDTPIEPKIQTVVRASPQSSMNFVLGNSVKPMIYRAEGVEHSPMSARRYVHQMPVRTKKQAPLLATDDGKILKPLTSERTRKLSMSSSNNTPLKISDVRPSETDEGFPLAQGGEMIVAAPMIGGSRGGRRGYRSNCRQSYYDDGPVMYPSYYYDGGYGYCGEDMGGYGRAYTCGGYSKRRSVHYIYASQMPEITLPTSSFDQGQNALLANTSNISNTPEMYTIKQYCDVKDENLGNAVEQPSKESNVKLISSAQQTDDEKELDFVCFSPERFSTTTEGPHDPKLRWRIVIKRGDEE